MQGEQEVIVTHVMVTDDQSAGREPVWQAQLARADLQEIARALEEQRFVGCLNL